LSNGKSVRPLKSSFSATPLEGVDGAVGVLGPVGVVGSDGESFTPPHAATATLHSASAVVSSPPPRRRRFGGTGLRRCDVTTIDPSSGYRLSFESGLLNRGVDLLQSPRMSGDEVIVFATSAVLAVVMWGAWYIGPRRIRRLGKPAAGRSLLDLAPLVSLGVLVVV
jgi:hypothetical protein